MYRVRKNHIGMFLSKIMKYRKSSRITSSHSAAAVSSCYSLSSKHTSKIERLSYTTGGMLQQDGSLILEPQRSKLSAKLPSKLTTETIEACKAGSTNNNSRKISRSHGVNVPATLRSSTIESSGVCKSGNFHPIAKKLSRSKRHRNKHTGNVVAVGAASMKTNFPRLRYHCLLEEENPVVAYFSDATLYPIPEDGTGICYAKYTTVYPYGEPDVWSIDQVPNDPVYTIGANQFFAIEHESETAPTKA